MSLFLWSFILFVFLYFIYYWFQYQKNIKKFSHLPNVIPQFWDAIEPLAMLRFLPRFLAPVTPQIMWLEKYKLYQNGSLFTIPSRLGGMLVIADPDIMQQVTTNKDTIRTKVGGNMIYGQSLFIAEGEVWRRHRKIASYAFSDKHHRLVHEATCRIVNLMFGYWDKKSGTKNGEEVVVETIQELTQISLAVLAHAGFGKPVEWNDSHDKKGFSPKTSSSHMFTFQQNLQILSDYFLHLLILPQWLIGSLPFTSMKILKTAHDDFLLHLKEIVVERKEMTNQESVHRGNDLFTNLLTAMNASENVKNNLYLTENELYGNLFAFAFAGHETTSGTLNYALSLLALYPQIQHKCYQQIENTLHGSVPTYEDIAKLLYPSYIIKETLRLFPLAPATSKTAIKPITINLTKSHYPNFATNTDSGDDKISLLIPSGTRIVLDLSALHRNPFYWNRPDEFLPERFDVKSKIQEGVRGITSTPPSSSISSITQDEDDRQSASDGISHHRFAWLPFAEGPQRCIGKKFAEIESILVLTLFLQRYSIHLSPKMNPQTFLESKPGAILKPNKPIELIFKKRLIK